MTVVVADTSPLNYLILIDSVEVLANLYGRVLIPEAVLQELGDSGAPLEVRKWIVSPPKWLEVHPGSASIDKTLAQLDPGEAAAIALAQSLDDPLLLIDDAKGREEATRRGVRNTGTLGVLVAAAAGNLIKLPEVLPRLLKTNFRASAELINSIIVESERNR